MDTNGQSTSYNNGSRAGHGGGAGGGKRSMKAMMKNAEMLRLRRFLLPLLIVKSHRRQRAHRRRGEPMPSLEPSDLAHHLLTTTTFISKWGPDILKAMCAKPIVRFAFAGEPITYPDEPVSSHGLILILRGTVVTMRASQNHNQSRRKQKTPTQSASHSMAASATRGEFDSTAPSSGRSDHLEYSSNFQRSPAAVARHSAKGVPKTNGFDEKLAAPCTVGEMMCLTEGLNPCMMRASSPVVDYVIINVSAIREAINTRLSAELLAATFTREVALARKAAVARGFAPVAPMISRHYVCKDMSAHELQLCIAALETDFFYPGQDIVVQGSTGATMYFFRRGTAREIVNGEPGASLGPTVGDGAFGEMAVLFQEKRVATIRAVTPCDLYVLRKKDLERIIRHSDVKHKIIANAANARTLMVATLPPDTIVQSLQRHAVFGRLRVDALEAMVAAAHTRVFPAGTLLVSAATQCDEMICIYNGYATTQDVYAHRYGPQDLIGDLCLCPHRNMEIIAATTMVDAFVFPRQALVSVLRRHHQLDAALHDCELRLVATAHRRGQQPPLLTTRAPAPPPHLVVPPPPSPRDASNNDAAVTSPSRSPQTVGSSQSPANNNKGAAGDATDAGTAITATPFISVLYHRKHKYEQPNAFLRDEAVNFSGAARRIQEETERLLRYPPVSGAMVAIDEKGLDRLQRAARRRRQAAGAENNSDSDHDRPEDNGSAQSPLNAHTIGVALSSDFFSSDKWRENAAFTKLMSDDAFLERMVALPSRRHIAFTSITLNSETSKKKKDVPRWESLSLSRAPLPPTTSPSSAAKATTASKTEPLPHSDSKAAIRARMKALQSVCEAQKTVRRPPGAGEARPLFRPVNPHSYAPILPQSMVPLTSEELLATPWLADSMFGPAMPVVDDGHQSDEAEERQHGSSSSQQSSRAGSRREVNAGIPSSDRGASNRGGTKHRVVTSTTRTFLSHILFPTSRGRSGASSRLTKRRTRSWRSCCSTLLSPTQRCWRTTIRRSRIETLSRRRTPTSI
jgi:CRP-like cAMP-binding protein